MAKHLVIGNVWYHETFIGDLFGGENKFIRSPNDLNDVDLLVFWGGSDISPELYKEKNLFCLETNPARDKFEAMLFKYAVGHIPMLGICRGAQFLCAMSGGKLWQDVGGHNTTHDIVLNDGTIVEATSTHHQMMRPSLSMEVLATTVDTRSPVKKNDTGSWDTSGVETEIAYSPETQSLMIQGHPEYSYAGADFVRVTKDLTTKYLGIKS